MQDTAISTDRQALNLKTEREAASILRVSRQTLWRLRTEKNGDLPYYRIAGRILYDYAALERFAQSHAVEAA